MLGILQQNKELSSHTPHQRPIFWVQKNEKNPKKCQDMEVFLNFNIHLLQINKCCQYKFFTQALCWGYCSKPKNLIIILFIRYPNFEFKNWRKKNLKKIRNWRWTNKWYPISIFCTSPMLRILQQTKELSIIHFKDHSSEFKS